MELTFRTREGRFNYRVGAIIIHQSKVLMIKNNQVSYLYSVGGRVNYDETCDEAVRREVKEELGIEVEIDRPVFLHECFFDDETTKEHFHEVSLYYLMKTPDNIGKVICKSVDEKGNMEEIFWMPIDRYGEFNAYPSFFATELTRLPENMKHIVEIQNRRKHRLARR